MTRPAGTAPEAGLAVRAILAGRADPILSSFTHLAKATGSPAGLEVWLAEWSELEDVVEEARHVAMIEWACETGNPACEATFQWVSGELALALARHRRGLSQSVLEQDPPAGLSPLWQRFRADLRTSGPEFQGRIAEIETLGRSYQRLIAELRVPWDGRALPLNQLGPYYASPQRAIREEAWRREDQALRGARPQFVELFGQLLGLRARLASEAGCAGYRDYAWLVRHRFEYSPADCRRLRKAIADRVVPVLVGMRESRRRALGVGSLRPWDLQVVPGTVGAPRYEGGPAELATRTSAVLRALDPVQAGWFDQVMESGLHDLQARPGKAPGAFCASLYERRMPFLFLNATGAPSDVSVLLHEAGHALHDMATRLRPLFWHRRLPPESAELASMTVEFLALTHLDCQGGLITSDLAPAVRRMKLEEALSLLCQVAAADEFQDQLYNESPGLGPDERDALWARVQARYDPVVDWTGLEDARRIRWYRQRHLFRFPFYAIEYALAQLAAIHLWHRYLADPVPTLTAFRDALALGAAVHPGAVYRAAGAGLWFDDRTVATLMDQVARAWLHRGTLA